MEQQQQQQADQQQPLREKNRKNKLSKGFKGFAKFTGIAFQMLGIILITTWGGTKLDHMAGFKTPVFTIVLSLLGVFAAIYVVVKDFIKFK